MEKFKKLIQTQMWRICRSVKINSFKNIETQQWNRGLAILKNSETATNSDGIKNIWDNIQLSQPYRFARVQRLDPSHFRTRTEFLNGIYAECHESKKSHVHIGWKNSHSIRARCTWTSELNSRSRWMSGWYDWRLFNWIFCLF